MTATMTPLAPAQTLAFDEAGSGPPLVLLHAFPLDRGTWRRQVHPLSERHRVIVPDLFGFGESPLAADGWTVDSMADTLAAFTPNVTSAAPGDRAIAAATASVTSSETAVPRLAAGIAPSPAPSSGGAFAAVIVSSFQALSVTTTTWVSRIASSGRQIRLSFARSGGSDAPERSNRT